MEPAINIGVRDGHILTSACRLSRYLTRLKSREWAFLPLALVALSSSACAENQPRTIPLSEFGAKTATDYHGDGLAVEATAQGTRLRCVFQRLEGEATGEGLWLTSTATTGAKDRFQVVGYGVGRLPQYRPFQKLFAGAPDVGEEPACQTLNTLLGTELSRTGAVIIAQKLVRFTRPGLVEEYSVSMDGLRQDFVVLERPGGEGELAVQLAVSCARVRPAPGGVQLVLDRSRRKIAYNRLRATDATGRELPARLKIVGQSESQRNPISQPRVARALSQPDSISQPLSVASALSQGDYSSQPRVVTPLFPKPDALPNRGEYRCANFHCPFSSDRKSGGPTLGWNTKRTVNPEGVASGASPPHRDRSGMCEADLLNLINQDRKAGTGSEALDPALLVLVDDAEAVYPVRIDPTFTDANWVSMNPGVPGVDGTICAAVIDGSGNLYVGGDFAVAGGGFANHIAKWDGTTWSALGSGINGIVYALAVSGSNLYAGGSSRIPGQFRSITSRNGTATVGRRSALG